MFKHNVTRLWLTAGLVVVAAGFPSAAQAKSAPHPPQPYCPPPATVCNTLVPEPAGTSARTTAKEKRAAAAVTTSAADAMQAAAVAHGEANSSLSNPYIEQKVTTPESVGVNRTKVPAGGF
jgi:hypothetical protein